MIKKINTSCSCITMTNTDLLNLRFENNGSNNIIVISCNIGSSLILTSCSTREFWRDDCRGCRKA